VELYKMIMREGFVKQIVDLVVM